MNEVMSAILSRRSTRKFTDQPISEDILNDIVKAALHAPSGMGKQTWQFTMITNKEVISRLADTIAKELDRMYAQIAKNLAAINIKVEKGEMTLNEALDATQKLQDSTLLKKIIKFETYKTLLKIKNKDTI
jgi:nitroreductase